MINTTISFYYNGHHYTFNNNVLFDDDVKPVAKLELANFQDEYKYYIDLVSGEVMHSEHENTVLFDQDHIFLAGQYEAFNS